MTGCRYADRRLNKSKINPEGGTVLIVILVISLLLIVGMQWYSRVIRQMTREEVQGIVSQRAFDLADSGVYSALHMLRTPGDANLLKSGTWLNGTDAGAPVDLSSATATGRYDVSLYRSMDDSSLVDAISTGYYYIPTGSYMINGRRAHRAVVRAKIRVRYVGDFFAAIPDNLTVGYGTDISGGDIYGKSITFQAPDGISPHTKVRTAYYLNGYSPMPAPFVTFFSTPPVPVQLTSDPNLVSPDATMTESYRTMAGNGGLLAKGVHLSGVFPSSPPTSPYKVYFCPGDIYLGAPGFPLQINDMVVIYATGTVYIENNITQTGGGNRWLGMISVGDIHITALPAGAPDNLSIIGTYVTGGRFVADGGARSSGNLTFTGGFTAKVGVDFAGVYRASRVYAFAAADKSMALPYFTYFESYTNGGRN
jgi:hypothetical protein